MPYFQTTEHRFHYLEQGTEEPTILLLHSTGIGAWQWQAYRSLLKTRHTVALDFLGYSPSDPWKQYASAIRKDFEAAKQLVLMQPGKVDIVGHSYGGFLGLMLAKEQPKKIRSMLLHEPVAWGCIYNSDRIDLQHSFDQLCARLFSQEARLDTDTWLHNFVGYWNTPETWTNLPEKTKNIWRTRFPKVFAEVSELCLDRTPLSYWSTIEHAICITLSDNSPEHEKLVCSLLSTTLKNAKLQTHRGGHLAPMTDFPALKPIVERWLQNVNRKD